MGSGIYSHDKRITVVIPNYNGREMLRECVSSILAGSVVPQIIVVDNDSEDGSVQMLKETFPQVQIAPLTANTGFCHAVNTGIHLTRTPYVMLLNNDTRVEKDCIAQLLVAAEEDDRIFSVQALMLSMQDAERIDDAGDMYCALGWAFPMGKGRRLGGYRPTRRIFSACAGAAIYRMDALKEVGLFDERHFCYLEDVDLGYRARIFGYDNRLCPEAVVYHYGSASSGELHNAFKEEMAAGNNLYLLYKNMPALQYALNAPLIFLGRAVKRRYFVGKGLGEAYLAGIERGKLLCEADRAGRENKRRGLPEHRESIRREAALDLAPDTKGDVTRLDRFNPLYLGGRISFSPAHLLNYMKIQLLLWGNLIRRLRA
ncbi:MAG: glycosyltransferase family 2 protein [Lachnospiraceae bacterium]|nr:glycosyltransferase family 2 protein [Lachnospiraceae bacterium]